MKLLGNIISLLFLLQILVVSCSRKIEDPIYVRTVVDSTKRIHWGQGKFKVHVYYSFKTKEKEHINSRYTKKFELAYTSEFKKGDSIKVVYDENDPEKNWIVD